jgi:sporulation protein YlmC with PRC-barrel domain
VGTSSASTQVGTSAASTEVGTSAASTQVGTSAASTQVGTSSAATQVGTANATAGATTEANLPLLIQSDKLIGMSIQDNTGTSLGQISDVFVDISGTVQAVALNMSATGTPSASSTQNGSATQSSTQSATSAATSAATSSAATTGTPNTTGNAVFVPWTDIKADVNTQALVYNGSMTTLSSLPAYNASQFSSGYVLRSTGTGTSTSLPSQYEGLIRLGAPNNVKLQTTSNDTVGTLQNVIVDMNSGKATYAAVDVSTFVGATNDVVLVPWTMFKLDNTSGSSNTSMTPVIRLNVTKSSLQNAPKFDATSLSLWPTPAQPTWDNQIKLFWQTSGV